LLTSVATFSPVLPRIHCNNEWVVMTRIEKAAAMSVSNHLILSPSPGELLSPAGNVPPLSQSCKATPVADSASPTVDTFLRTEAAGETTPPPTKRRRFRRRGPKKSPRVLWKSAFARVLKRVRFQRLHREVMADPFAESDPVSYAEARELFEERSEQIGSLLHEDQVRAAGYRGLIHFGNNRTHEGVGVAAKPHALGHMGGAQLTFANLQEPLAALKRNRVIQGRTASVRNVNNARISAARLEIALKNQEMVYFHLNQFDRPIIDAIIAQDEDYTTDSGFSPVNGSVTAQELYHVYRNWDRFEHNVVFLRNLRPVNKPW